MNTISTRALENELWLGSVKHVTWRGLTKPEIAWWLDIAAKWLCEWKLMPHAVQLDRLGRCVADFERVARAQSDRGRFGLALQQY